MGPAEGLTGTYSPYGWMDFLALPKIWNMDFFSFAKNLRGPSARRAKEKGVDEKWPVKIWVNMDWIIVVCAKNMGKYGLD